MMRWQVSRRQSFVDRRSMQTAHKGGHAMKQRKFAGRTILISACIIIGLVAAAFTPWGLGQLSSHPHPVNDYAEAVQRITSLASYDSAKMNPVCQVQFMTHGQKTSRAIVLVHGYTACPQQFHELGQELYDLGYNVLIAPLPHHGLADRMTSELSQLTAEELAAYGDQMVDIAQGLGHKVIMAGISGGGVVTAWAAQNRSDLDEAVIISPAFGFKQIPTKSTAPAMNLTSLLPESYAWWDAALKTEIQPPYAYPRYSMHGLAQILRLGFSVQVAARRDRPATVSLIVVTNGAEPSVNNALTQEVVTSWRARGANVRTFEFDAALKLPHDLIDPNQPDQQIDVVYAQLIKLIGH